MNATTESLDNEPIHRAIVVFSLEELRGIMGLPDRARIVDVRREMDTPDTVKFLIESPDLPPSNHGTILPTVTIIFERVQTNRFRSWIP